MTHNSYIPLFFSLQLKLPISLIFRRCENSYSASTNICIQTVYFYARKNERISARVLHCVSPFTRTSDTYARIIRLLAAGWAIAGFARSVKKRISRAHVSFYGIERIAGERGLFLSQSADVTHRFREKPAISTRWGIVIAPLGK